MALLVAGCSSAGDERGGGSSVALPDIKSAGDEMDQLDAARVRWEAAGIDSYTWSFTRVCFCPPLTAEVRVEGGEAVDRSIDVEFGEVADVDFTTMEELFDFVEHEIDDSDEVTVDYDPETGQVISFDADRITEAVDDELGYRVQSFVPADQRRPALDDVELTESFPCGHGFQGSNAAQTVGVILEIDRSVGLPAAITDLPDPQWRARLIRGEHLFANWCNDVVSPGDLTRQVTASLPIVAGTITFEGPVPAFDDYGASVSATLTGLVAEHPDGSRVELQEAVLVNDNWGGAAG